MRGEGRLLQAGQYLVGRACRRLPPEVREERYREWAAELPAILHDPGVRSAPLRAVRMLGYAADTLRGAIVTPDRARDRIPRMSPVRDLLFPVSALAVVALNVWSIVQAPGDGQNYLQLAWGVLFVAYLIRKRVRPAGRMTALLLIGTILALVAIFLVNAAQTPGAWAWVNYFLAVLFLLPLLVGLPLAWWLRRLQARTGGRHAAPPDPWTF